MAVIIGQYTVQSETWLDKSLW